MFRRLLSALRPSPDRKRFIALLIELERPLGISAMKADLQAVVSGSRTRHDALNDFTALLAARDEISTPLRQFGWLGVSGLGGAEKLRELYALLQINGGFGRVGTYHVTTACIYVPELLTYVLRGEGEGESYLNITSNVIRALEQKTKRRWRPD
jgi:hypothetical protein